jgi:uncharacterized membrane protein YfcA
MIPHPAKNRRLPMPVAVVCIVIALVVGRIVGARLAPHADRLALTAVQSGVGVVIALVLYLLWKVFLRPKPSREDR